jgi:serine/threonine protein kinase
VTLLSLLGAQRKPGIKSTLGARFELARKLVRAVCLLHSTGWLHKNIRAESVIFFPEHVSALQEDRFEIKIAIDVSQPILMGYLFSRPDDISRQIPAGELLEWSAKPALPISVRDTSTASRRHTTDAGVWQNAYDNPTAQPWRPQVKARVDSIYGRNMLTGANAGEATKETIVSGFTLDYYQHPAKHADPKRPYRHAYDVYSLGILLLEVGLWEHLRNYEDNIQSYPPLVGPGGSTG